MKAGPVLGVKDRGSRAWVGPGIMFSGRSKICFQESRSANVPLGPSSGSGYIDRQNNYVPFLCICT